MSHADGDNILLNFFKNKEGKVVIGQWPNIPIIAYFTCTILSKILTQGSVHSLFTTLAFGTLFTWAWLEIFYGISYFRRTMGVIVIIFAVYNQIN